MEDGLCSAAATGVSRRGRCDTSCKTRHARLAEGGDGGSRMAVRNVAGGAVYSGGILSPHREIDAMSRKVVPDEKTR